MEVLRTPIEFKEVNKKCKYSPIKYTKQEQPVNTPENIDYNNQNAANPILGILNDQFYLIKIIGKGSTSSVFLSYSIYDQNVKKKLYAIKIIQQGNQDEHFRNICEVNFLEKVDHKNILKFYGRGLGLLKASSGLMQIYYIIMDYLDHGSLLNQIGDNIGFGEDYGRIILSQLLDGLEVMHNSNIIHLDIKLENIMISGDDYTLKYIDFGFATEKSNGYLTTFLGTPNYAAPELHLKQPYLGVYEDIFSLGVTLFIIVTGHLPFILPLPDDPLYQYIFCVDYINYWRNRKLKVSPSFMELFDNLIAFDPTQRPSISEIRNCKWMQEINWNLLPSLQQEFRRREEIINKKISFCETNENTISINGINNNNINADDMLLKIRQEKKIDVINSIKNQLFPNNNINKRNLDKKKSIKNESNEGTFSCQNDNELKHKNENSLVGFIKFKKTKIIKNMNSLKVLLRKYLKNEGYKKIKKNMNFLNVEITNGEMDVLLSIKKMYKEIKIKYIITNGNKEDLLNFNKIMKRFKIN